MNTASLPQQYREELLSSAIAPELIDYLVDNGFFYELAGNYEVAEFLNRSFARFGWKDIKEQQRGWVFRGLDPETWEQMTWGCFKPDRPRQDFSKQGKYIKYDAPVGSKKRVFIVPSPGVDWQNDYTDASIHKVIAEGFKKSASLVSNDYRAIGLDGVWCGVRKTESGELRLIDDLERCAIPGTVFTIIFDKDTKPRTAREVQRAQIALGQALEKRGCIVKIAQLPGPEKGVDDFVAAQGREALDLVMQQAISLTEFLDQCWDAAIPEISSEPSQVVDQRYLDVQLPDTGLIVLLSPMGTGKTELLKRELGRCPSVLSLTHRITLGRQAANRLNLALYSDANIQRCNRLEITVDSLYKLPTYNNRYHTVVLDEVEQVLSHMLDSSTCKAQRVQILQKFAYFIQSAERVIIQQAELSDSAINYLSQLRGGEKPYVIVNEHHSESRIVGWYNQPEPSRLVADLCESIKSGERALIACYSKKRAKRLHKTLSKRFPTKRIRAVHGDNSGDADTIAFVERINEAVLDLDILIFTPSMSTGVSIDAHSFNGVWGIFDTAECHSSELLQMLGRYRQLVPWYVWSAKRSAGYIGSPNPEDLQSMELERNRRTGILTEIDPMTGSEGGPHLQCWAEIKARCNASRLRQREVLRKLLAREGHCLFEMDGGKCGLIQAELDAAKLELQEEEAQAIESAPDLTDSEAEALEFRAERLTQADRHKLEKYRLRQGYQMPVTSDLVARDKEGRLLRAILALEELFFPEVALERDLKDIERYKFIPDRRHRTLKRTYREKLGLKQFLDLDREWTRDDLEQLGYLVDQCRDDIKQVLNLTIPEGSSECWVLAQLLQQIGVKLTSRREGGRGSQVRVYRLDRERWQFISEVLERRRNAREKRQHPIDSPRNIDQPQSDQLDL